MLKYLVICVIAIASYFIYNNYPISHGPGIIAEDAPAISSARGEKPFEFNNATLTPVKKISGTVRVIKKEPYFFDTFSSFSPLDALVSWNELSDERNLEFIYFSLSDRKFDVELTRPPLEVSTIYKETDLWHLIPSSGTIKEKLREIRNGSIIEIEGWIVNIETTGMFKFTNDLEKNNYRNEKGLAIWIDEFHIR